MDGNGRHQLTVDDDCLQPLWEHILDEQSIKSIHHPLLAQHCERNY